MDLYFKAFDLKIFLVLIVRYTILDKTLFYHTLVGGWGMFRVK